jgi:clan AA aspartic protease (TIGR02281 family)
MGFAMRAHVAAKSLGFLTAVLVLFAGDPFGGIDGRTGAALAYQNFVQELREKERQEVEKREEARRHDDEQRLKKLQLDVDLARIQQQDLALSIRKREVELEQERRRTAAIELAALKSQRETLEKRIEYARKTVLASFDVSDRGFVPDPQKLPASLQRAKRLRENMLKRLLMYRGDSKNYIADGTALNFFVELCGKSAFASEFYQAAAQKVGPGPNPVGMQWLNQLAKVTLINPQDLAQIRYQQGLSGPKLSGRLNEEPLDTNWPAILRSEKFRPYTGDIEKRRAEVLAQLRNKKSISPKSADGLLDAANNLLTAIQDEELALMQRLRENGSPRREKKDWFRLHTAEEPIRVLLAGCYRLIEARKIEDVSLPPLAGPQGVTVERLLAYMHENKLNFSPSDANGQVAYGRILELMVVYYTDLAQYKIDTENGERKVETLKRQEDEINEVVLGNKLNNIQQTEIEVSKWNAIGEIGRAVVESSRDSRAFYSSTVPLHQVGAAMCATVVINEKRELEMVVDTGCTSMSLPHAIAVECGVNLAAGRAIPVHVADGSVVQAKAVVLESVRVGHFTAHNVECTVFPPEVDKAPPLLGMSFLGRFKVQLNGDQMVLAPRN